MLYSLFTLQKSPMSDGKQEQNDVIGYLAGGKGWEDMVRV